MSVVFDLLFAWKARSTHHKLAMDALRELQTQDALGWEQFFLGHLDAYLEGAKAPDTQFKDFRNHVLHPAENYWGGAVKATERAYQDTVATLRKGDWPAAAFKAGVLSHYYTDVLMPFHTGQSEQEGVVHRAGEWSVTQSYEDLLDVIDSAHGGLPIVSVPDTDDWLARMVREAADLAHKHYQTLIDHYDLSVGRSHPAQGFDAEGQRCLAEVLGHAIVGLARILDRAIDDAGVQPPPVNLTPQIVLGALTIPFRWVANNVADRHQRAVIEAIWREYQASGKVVHALPEDERSVRADHAKEVLKTPLFQLDHQPIEPPGAQFTGGPGGAAPKRRPSSRPRPMPSSSTAEHSGGSTLGTTDAQGTRWYLSEGDPVENAPSVGPKTAKRLAKLDVETVGDLLDLDPDEAAESLGVRHIQAETIQAWQAQARLVCEVPNLRGHDAQILVGCGIESPEQLATAQSDALLPMVEAYSATRDGQWITRGKVPDLAEISNWIQWASQRRSETRSQAA